MPLRTRSLVMMLPYCVWRLIPLCCQVYCFLPRRRTTLETRWGRNMQEAKRYEAWHVMHTVPYEVLNVANMASGRQAWGRLNAWTHRATHLAMALLTVLGTSSIGKLF